MPDGKKIILKKFVKKKKKKNQSSFNDSPRTLSPHRCVIVEKARTTPNVYTDTRLCASTISRKLNPRENEKKYEKRVFSSFNKSSNRLALRAADKEKVTRMPFYNNFTSAGLTSKEKSYIICNCQSRCGRYMKLKNLAASAMQENKVFSVYGSCNAVRKALLDRGWVEKIPQHRMNLSRIRNGTFSSKTEIHNELEKLLLSNLVEKHNPNFIWRTKETIHDTTIDMKKEYNTIINKLRLDALWTTKQGLCSSMKDNYWFHIEDVAEVIGPRTYSSDEMGEVEDFIKDYKITACTSLLKWLLSMVANERPIFDEAGRVSMNIVVFALNRCKEFLFQKQNKDIDRSFNTISTGQWNAFLKKYYHIIGKDEVFEIDKDKKLPLYLCYAKFFLKEMHRYRPQLSCEGCHNIWIIKPAHNSRGRGIRMASKLGVITNLITKCNAKYVIQKYIEEPLLIHETKFDIRQYYLVTSTYPLVIWMYRDCYLKFSSQIYSLKNFHESIHLTNNAVQRKYNNCKNRHPELPQQNMWDLDTYKRYLNRIDKEKVWDNIIYPGMKKSIVGIMLSCQDSLSVSRNRFEIYGCDFILDKEYKPWLIEINSCPDLNHTTQVTAKICPAVVSDIIKVVIDHAGNLKAPTGKFECIYRQPITVPRYGIAADLSVRGYSLPIEYFYRGNIELKELYNDAGIDKERDIKAILKKLKDYYDTAIMVEPEEELYVSKNKEQETCTHITKSEHDLNVTATIITGQLEELLDKMISEHSFSSKSGPRDKESISFPSTRKFVCQGVECRNDVDVVHSAADIKSLVHRSFSQCTSAEVVTIQETFPFSELDDGPLGKASVIDVGALKRTFHDLPSTTESFDVDLKKSASDTFFKTEYSGTHATNQIIKFLSRTENEYFNQ